jgi:hypothetical protein
MKIGRLPSSEGELQAREWEYRVYFRVDPERRALSPCVIGADMLIRVTRELPTEMRICVRVKRRV